MSMRRVLSSIAAAVVAAAILVPVGPGSAPASAWEQLSTRCSRPTPTTVGFLVNSGIDSLYHTGLRAAAESWDAWSATTGVSVKIYASAIDAPANSVLVDVAQDRYTPTGSDAYAAAGRRCSGSTMVGGIVHISTVNMTPVSESWRREVFIHEMGHILGLNHPSYQRECTTAMLDGAWHFTHCSDGNEPYPDDVAGVVEQWNPGAVRGFPADARIRSIRGAGSELQSPYSYTSAWGGGYPLHFTTGNTQGFSDWTFVKDKARNGWGWVVNTGSGQCLTTIAVRVPGSPGLGTFENTTANLCRGDKALWMGRELVGGGVQLLQKSSGGCLGLDVEIDVATLLDCEDPDTRLTFVKSTSTRGKRSLPDDVAAGHPIVGGASNRCLTATGGARTAGTGISLRTCDASVEQGWQLHAVPGGYAFGLFRNTVPNEADVPSPERCATASGGTVSLQSCEGSSEQTWTLDAAGTIRNQATGTCLNVSGGATGDGASLILYGCVRTSNEIFNVTGLYQHEVVSLAPAASEGGVLGTAPAPTGQVDNRIRTVLTTKSSENSTRWGFEQVAGTGGWLMKNLDTGTCLRWRGWSSQAALDGACDGADPSYLWAPAPNADGTVTIEGKYSGEVIDLWGNGMADGTAIGTYPRNGAVNQKWRVVINPPTFADAAPNPAAVPANVARFGTATQSSTYSHPLGGGPRSAIDGIADGDFYDGSVTHTQSEQYAWWQVDLGQATAIDSATFYNRTDCCTDRSKDVWYLFSPTPFPAGVAPQDMAARVPGLVAYRVSDNTGASRMVKPVPGNYRYVRVQLAGTDFLSLSEVVVNAVP